MIKLAGSEWLHFKLTFKHLSTTTTRSISCTHTHFFNKMIWGLSFQLKKKKSTKLPSPHLSSNNTAKTFGLVFNSFPIDGLAPVKPYRNLAELRWAEGDCHTTLHWTQSLQQGALESTKITLRMPQISNTNLIPEAQLTVLTLNHSLCKCQYCYSGKV